MAKLCPRKTFLMSSLFIDVTFNKSTVIGRFVWQNLVIWANHLEQNEVV